MAKVTIIITDIDDESGIGVEIFSEPSWEGVTEVSQLSPAQTCALDISMFVNANSEDMVEAPVTIQ